MPLVIETAYIDERNHPQLLTILKERKQDLKKRTRRGWWDQYSLVRSIQKIRSKSATSEEAIAHSYDKEYGHPKTRYGYASLMLSRKGFELVTGLRADSVSPLHVLDIGAGSNEFLRFCRDELKIFSSHLIGSDISSASARLIREDGFTAYEGRVEKLGLPSRSFDLIYLSYFIDYDTDQKGTFDAVLDLIKPGGRIVLEGLFPVRPFAFLNDAGSNVTKGETVDGDIQFVKEAFVILGQNKGMDVRLERVVNTHRYVRSRYGFRRLPSTFLTFVVSA